MQPEVQPALHAEVQPTHARTHTHTHTHTYTCNRRRPRRRPRVYPARLYVTATHSHTHTHIYIFIYMCVTADGLAAAHFARLKAAGITSTACVDLVAASGGYMIASTASTILAAPFAIVGSIGVVGGAPNLHKLLEKGGVE